MNFFPRADWAEVRVVNSTKRWDLEDVRARKARSRWLLSSVGGECECGRVFTWNNHRIRRGSRSRSTRHRGESVRDSRKTVLIRVRKYDREKESDMIPIPKR